MKLLLLLSLALASFCVSSTSAQPDFLGVWNVDLGDCFLVLNLRETSFMGLLAPQTSDCEDVGIFLGPITITSPASDSDADAAIIVSYIEVPEFAHDAIAIGATYIFDLYFSGSSSMTMRNDFFEDVGFWPEGGLEATMSSDFSINGVYDGNDTSLTYVSNEFFLRLGGFVDEIQSDRDYNGASVGIVQETDVNNRFVVFPVVESRDFDDDDHHDDHHDDDEDFEGQVIDFVRSGNTWLVDLAGPNYDLIFTDRPDDDLNGVWYGRDPMNGDDCIQTTEFFNGIFIAYRFQCEDGVESATTNLTLAFYIGRYEVLPNDQVRLRYAHAVPEEDLAGYEVVFDSVITDDQVSLTGQFSEEGDTFTITLNRADRSASSIVVEITIDADINTFNVGNFLAGLAEALGIPPSTIEVLSVSAGSVVVEVAIREDLSDTEAPDLATITERLDALASGSVSVGGYTVQSVAADREDPGPNSSAAGVTASLFAVTAALVAYLV